MHWWQAIKLIGQWRLPEYALLLRMRSVRALCVLLSALLLCLLLASGLLLPLDQADTVRFAGQLAAVLAAGVLLTRLVASDYPRPAWHDELAFTPLSPPPSPAHCLHGRVFIVTGGNRGIGYWTARGLAERGARVVIAGRDSQQGMAAARRLQQQLSTSSVQFMALDLAELASIRQFASLFAQHYQRLDGLVANAGCLLSSKVLRTTRDGFELQIGVNHVGHCYLVQQLRPLLVAGSRIVFVSSVAHALFCPQRRPRPDWILDLHPVLELYQPLQAYGKSKLANVLAAADLQRQLQPLGVTVVSCHPGEVATDLYRDLPRPVRGLFKLLAALLLMQPQQGANTPLFCTLSSRVQPGAFYMSCRRVQPSPAASDPILARDLSSLTSQLYESYG